MTGAVVQRAACRPAGRRDGRGRAAAAIALAAWATIAPHTSRVAAETRIHLPYAGRDIVRPPSPVTQLGGSVDGVATDGHYAFAGIGPRFVVLDLEPAGTPVRVWQSPPLAGPVREVVLTQQRVWLAVGPEGHLQAYDVHDPRAPRRVFEGRVREGAHVLIGASGNLLFARAGWGDVVDLIDVSAPARPAVVGSVTLKSQGVAMQAVAQGRFLYVARYVDEDGVPGLPGIAVVDIDRPASPREVAFLRLPVEGGSHLEGPHALDVAGDRLVAVSISTTWWIDIARPTAPVVVGTRPGGVHDVATVGDTTWLLEGTHRAQFSLVTMDTFSPSRPRTVAAQPVPIAFRLAHGRDRVVAYGRGAPAAVLTVVNVAKPRTPRVWGQFMTLGYVNRAAPLDDRVIAARFDSIAVVPLDAAGVPPGVSSEGAMSIPSAGIDGNFLAARRDEIWTLDRDRASEGFHLVGWDVADMARPTARWRATATHHPMGFAAAGDVRFFGALLGWAAGLTTLDVADGDAPTQFGPLSGDADGGPRALAVHGDRLYAASPNALWAIDVREPHAWREIARVPIEPAGHRPAHNVLNLAVQGHTVLVTMPWGVAAFDTADGGLRAIGGLMLPPAEVAPGSQGAHLAAASAPGRLYVHTSSHIAPAMRVSAFDITRPLDPVLLRTWTHPGELPFYPCGLGADARTVAIAACDAGVLLLNAP